MKVRLLNRQVVEGTKLTFLLTIAIGLVITALSAAQLTITQRLTDSIVSVTTLQTPLYHLGLLLGVLLLVAGIRQYQSYLQRWIQLRVNYNLDHMLVELIHPTTITFIETPQFQNELNVVKFGFTSIGSLFLSIAQVTVAAASLFTYFTMIFQQIWYLPLVIAVTLLPRFLHENKLSVRRFDFAERTTELQREKASLQEILLKPAAMKEILIFAAKPFLRARWDRAYVGTLEKTRAFQRYEMFKAQLLNLTTITGQIGVHFFLIYEVVTQSVSIGVYVAILAAVSMIEQSAYSLATYTGQVKQYRITKKRCFDFLLKYADYSQHTDKVSIEKVNQITVNHLTFQYPNRSDMALRDISVQLHAHETIALVGDNGSGKSTLSKIIAGLHQVEEGRLLYNHIDSNVVNREQLFRSFSMITQDYMNYPLTIRECVGLTRGDDSQRFDEIKRMYPYLFEEGVSDDTVLGYEYEGSRQLSGGQWQKISIARALYKEAPFLILDEATASLDPETEYTLMQDIIRNRKQKGLIATTHRLHMCTLFSKIIVMHEGRIVESGCHEELMSKRGKYYSMFVIQQRKVEADHGSISTAL